MRPEEIKIEMENTLERLIQLLSLFNREEINVVPYTGSWTAGELASHMIKSISGFVEVLNGPVKDTGRDPYENIERIRDDFLNFNIKMKSPDFVVPEKMQYDKKSLLSSLNKIKTDLCGAIMNLDITKTCRAFEVPGYGFLTRLETVHFVLYHTQRHIHQLNKIFIKISDRRSIVLNKGIKNRKGRHYV